MLILLVVFGGLTGCTGIDPTRTLTTIWMVQPAEVPSEEVTVSSGDLVLRQPLHPTALAVLEADLQHGSGDDDFLPAGTRLFEVQNASAQVFCALNLAYTPDLQRILLGTSSAQRCLVDANNDSLFEGKFVFHSPIQGLPLVEGQLPKDPDPVEPPVPYRRGSPSEVGDEYFVGIRYEGKPLLYNRRNFRIRFGNSQSQDGLTNFSYTSGDDYPKSHNMLGSQFTIVAEDDGTLTIRIDRMMPLQPFSVTQTVSYRFY
ncbi:MAG: hypothetical protein LC634_11405 [Sphingomonadales bacterium]|nr:hypothetical protein [Sphingomonadales bacterium]